MNEKTTSETKGNILIVDDSPTNLRLLVNLLKNKGYQVRPAASGQLALSAAVELPPDLILLDIMMPEMDGYQVCERLKSNENTKNIPVIFVSAVDEVLDKVKAFTVGGVDYLTKPIQFEEVLARIETHLKICRLQRNLEEKNQELSNTLNQLKQAQDELIHSEKMAALGHLVAGIAHEINTPLGAIRSSIENIADFLQQNLDHFPEIFQEISADNYRYFLQLLKIAKENPHNLASREKRKLKKELNNLLATQEIQDADVVADTLVDLGISLDNVNNFIPLLQQAHGSAVIDRAYEFATLQSSTRTIQTATERAGKIVFALKSYAHYDAGGEKISTDLVDNIETVLTLYHNQLKQGVEVIKNYQNIPPVSCYPDELTQVWTNLIHNALQAMDYQGKLTIDIGADNDEIFVKITDTGHGIPPEIMSKIFQPFFTTKPLGEGSGLGLDIVKKIIDKHDGRMEVASVPGQTSFSVFIPNLI